MINKYLFSSIKIIAIYAYFFVILKVIAVFIGKPLYPNLIIAFPFLLIALFLTHIIMSKKYNWISAIVFGLFIIFVRIFEMDILAFLQEII